MEKYSWHSTEENTHAVRSIAMGPKKTIYVVDDEIYIASILCEQLANFGYNVVPFYSAEELLARLKENVENVDSIVSDIYLKEVSGFDLCKAVREISPQKYIPIILTSGNDLSHEKAKSFEAGADDFLAKPFSITDLHLKIDALVNVSQKLKSIHSEVERLQEERYNLAHQRKCSMPLSITNIADPANTLLFSQWSRKNISTVFIDLRNFTAFTESAAPESVMDVLNKYYILVGRISKQYSGTICTLIGDGIAVIFNSAGKYSSHQEVAAMFALAVREELEAQREDWLRKGYELNFGISLAEGHAAIGTIGCEFVSQYIVIGVVMNFASRLCAIAKKGQVLASHRFYSNIPNVFVEPAGVFELKGVNGPVTVYNAMYAKSDRKSA